MKWVLIYNKMLEFPLHKSSTGSSVHESQSRMYENMIGRSVFWEVLLTLKV